MDPSISMWKAFGDALGVEGSENPSQRALLVKKAGKVCTWGERMMEKKPPWARWEGPTTASHPQPTHGAVLINPHADTFPHQAPPGRYFLVVTACSGGCCCPHFLLLQV